MRWPPGQVDRVAFVAEPRDDDAPHIPRAVDVAVDDDAAAGLEDAMDRPTLRAPPPLLLLLLLRTLCSHRGFAYLRRRGAFAQPDTLLRAPKYQEALSACCSAR